MAKNIKNILIVGVSLILLGVILTACAGNQSQTVTLAQSTTLPSPGISPSGTVSTTTTVSPSATVPATKLSASSTTSTTAPGTTAANAAAGLPTTSHPGVKLTSEGLIPPDVFLAKPITSADNKIIFGWAGGACEQYLYSAIQQGYFKKYGLDVTLQPRGTAKATDLVATGKVDVTAGLLLQFLKPVTEGMDIKFGIALHSGCISSIVLSTSPFKNWTDLKGKNIGITTIGDRNQVYASALISNEGQNPNDYGWKAYADNTALYLALEKGEIDALIGGDNLNYAQVNKGKARFLSYYATDPLFAGQTCCMLEWNYTFAQKNPDRVAAMSAALYEACLWIQGHKQQAVQQTVDNKYIGGTYDQWYQQVSTYDYIPGNNVGYESLVYSIDLFSRLGIIDKIKDPAAYANNLFIKVPGLD
jgi:NitT/TauT family transport system substrate-binding protein